MHIPGELTVAVIAAAVALLTFFTGFGLGTLLMPAFAWLLHDLPTAVAATAVVHLANNLLKLGLVGREAHRVVVLKFGGTAVLFSFLGAWVLTSVVRWPDLFTYTLGGQIYAVTVEKLIIAALMFLFAGFELLPAFNRLAFAPRWLPLGGALSGFFGGLSGHQGPLRSAFLMRCGLDKSAFVGTGAVCAVLVDTARLAVYGASLWAAHAAVVAGSTRLVGFGMAGAFVGTLLGNRLLHKVTWTAMRVTVGFILMLMAVALAAGLI